MSVRSKFWTLLNCWNITLSFPIHINKYRKSPTCYFRNVVIALSIFQKKKLLSISALQPALSRSLLTAHKKTRNEVSTYRFVQLQQHALGKSRDKMPPAMQPAHLHDLLPIDPAIHTQQQTHAAVAFPRGCEKRQRSLALQIAEVGEFFSKIKKRIRPSNRWANPNEFMQS